jgi:hypothetical protein
LWKFEPRSLGGYEGLFQGWLSYFIDKVDVPQIKMVLLEKMPIAVVLG